MWTIDTVKILELLKNIFSIEIEENEFLQHYTANVFQSLKKMIGLRIQTNISDRN